MCHGVAYMPFEAFDTYDENEVKEKVQWELCEGKELAIRYDLPEEFLDKESWVLERKTKWQDMFERKHAFEQFLCKLFETPLKQHDGIICQMTIPLPFQCDEPIFKEIDKATPHHILWFRYGFALPRSKDD